MFLFFWCYCVSSHLPTSGSGGERDAASLPTRTAGNEVLAVPRAGRGEVTSAAAAASGAVHAPPATARLGARWTRRRARVPRTAASVNGSRDCCDQVTRDVPGAAQPMAAARKHIVCRRPPQRPTPLSPRRRGDAKLPSPLLQSQVSSQQFPYSFTNK